MEKIGRLSKILQVILWSFFFFLPIITGVSWIFFEEFYQVGMMDRMHDVNISGLPFVLPLSLWSRGLGFVVSMIPATVDMVVLWYLIKLFSLYARGDVFTATNVRYIRRVGVAMLIGQALNPFYQSLLTIAITLGNPKGQRMISLGIGSSNLSEIVTAIMIIVVAWIMDEARKLQEEQALVI